MKVASSALQAKIASQSEGHADHEGGCGRGVGGQGDYGGRGSQGGCATGVWAWKDVPPPAAGSPQNKVVVETKTYNGCPKHLAGCIHTPEDCGMEAPEVNTPNAKVLAEQAMPDNQGSTFHDMD